MQQYNYYLFPHFLVECTCYWFVSKKQVLGSIISFFIFSAVLHITPKKQGSKSTPSQFFNQSVWKVPPGQLIQALFKLLISPKKRPQDFGLLWLHNLASPRRPDSWIRGEWQVAVEIIPVVPCTPIKLIHSIDLTVFTNIKMCTIILTTEERNCRTVRSQFWSKFDPILTATMWKFFYHLDFTWNQQCRI